MKHQIKRWLRASLGERGEQRVRALKFSLQRMEVRIFSSLFFLPTAYYWLRPGKFGSEQRAVFAGRQRYLLSADSGNVYLLRRNIHRLEKGLIGRPRKEIFALDYLNGTVECFLAEIRCRPCVEPGSDLHWAHDVLQQYFATVGSHAVVDEARQKFSSGVGNLDFSEKIGPFVRGDEPPPVSYEHFMRLCSHRSSVRWFQQRTVPLEVIDKAVFAASQAPSACNRQPFFFRIFNEADMIRQIADLPGGAEGFSQNFPALAVVVGQLRAYGSERDRHLIYIDSSLAAMSFILALEAQGVSSCVINWPEEDGKETAARALLDLDPDERIVMLIAFGYADPQGLVPFSQKKSLEQLRIYQTDGD